MFKVGDQVLMDQKTMEFYVSKDAYEMFKCRGVIQPVDVDKIKDMLFEVYAMMYDGTPATVVQVLRDNVIRIRLQNYETNVDAINLIMFKPKFDLEAAIKQLQSDLSRGITKEQVEAINKILEK
jgi:hypothetical protein